MAKRQKPLLPVPLPATKSKRHMINILLVEDNPDDARLVQKALRSSPQENFTIEHVSRVREAMHYLRKHRSVNVVLTDISLPDSQGMETFRLLRKASPNVPVVFMTGVNNRTLAIEAIKHGAQDYLLKSDYSSEFLTRIILYAIERKKYQDEATAAKTRTRELQQKTKLLRQQQSELLVLNKAKDDFISLASHQLRTPATGVKQYLGMMLEGFAGDVPEHLRDFLEKAYESNERQLDIVNDLLRIAQLDAGNMHLRRRNVVLQPMLQDIIREQQAKFKQRKQKILFEADELPLVVFIDSERMRMVFENLIDNASKYTADKRRIIVGIHQDGPHAVVSVKDEGVGIAGHDVGKIFDKFSRIANDRSELVGGSGLGLYWVKRIVDLHGGSIEVHSSPDRGSEFLVRI